MRRQAWIGGLAAALLASSSLAATLVENVRGYTLADGRLQQFAALEFEGDRITHIYASATDAAGSHARDKIDGNGATLLPGLIDAHGHIDSLGRALAAVDLVGVGSEALAAQRVAAFAAAHPEGWITGRGWNQVLWEGRDFPDRASLDQVAPDRPVALGRIDGHALWANSRALALAGITAETPDPEGGQIIRDARGRPTGVLVDNAMDAVFRAIPSDTDEDVAQYQHSALLALAAVGLTSVHDAGVSAQGIRALRLLQAQAALPVRVYAMLDVLDPDNDRYLAEGPWVDDGYMLDIRSVKISADGALGSRGAALFEAYSDQPGHTGLLLLTDEELAHHSSRAMQAGFQVNTHAIGDRANAQVLDLFAELIPRHDSRHLRHRIEHAQILRVADIPRFRELGVVASVQPTHATSDKNMAGDRLGEARLAGAYAWRSLLQAGAKLAGGSDFPVEAANPFFGLHAAVTRQDRDGEPPAGWLPDQKISREEALHLFTEGAAFAAHQEREIGRLAPGYRADFILVRDDYFDVPEADIWNNKVLATWVAGKQVYAVPAQR